MEFRHPLDSEMEQMKTIWKLCFGDTDAYIDLFFSVTYRPEYQWVCVEHGIVRSMLSMLPSVLNTNASIYKGAYIYAVATHPDARGRGLMTQLHQFMQQQAQQKGYQFLCLVPATSSLFQLYETLGYHTYFELAHRTFLKEDMLTQAVSSHIEQPTAEYFLKMRQLYLSSLPCSVQLDGTMQDAFYKQLIGGGYHTLMVQNKFGQGHIVWYQEQDTVIVREIGMSLQCFEGAVSALCDLLICTKLVVHLDLYTISGLQETHPYGMIKLLQDNMKLPKTTAYMNLMLD